MAVLFIKRRFHCPILQTEQVCLFGQKGDTYRKGKKNKNKEKKFFHANTSDNKIFANGTIMKDSSVRK